MVTSGGIRSYDAGGGLDTSAAEAEWPRLAVRNWLDPHPDAASFDETWEFSTTGDMTQGELETAGWTFVNCSAEVSSGVMWLTATSTSPMSARFGCSLTGDFDIVGHCIADPSYGATADGFADYCFVGGPAVFDTTNDILHGLAVYGRSSDETLQITRYLGTTYSTMSGGSAILCNAGDYFSYVLRLQRVSGSVYACVSGSIQTVRFVSDDVSQANNGFDSASTADADTMTGVGFMLSEQDQTIGTKIGCLFLRRFQ